MLYEAIRLGCEKYHQGGCGEAYPKYLRQRDFGSGTILNALILMKQEKPFVLSINGMSECRVLRECRADVVCLLRRRSLR